MANFIQMVTAVLLINSFNEAKSKNIQVEFTTPSWDKLLVIPLSKSWTNSHSKEGHQSPHSPHIIHKRNPDDGLASEEVHEEHAKQDELSRLPFFQLGTNFEAYKYPFLPPKPIPAPELLKDPLFFTDIKRALPIMNFLEEAKKIELIPPEPKHVEPPPPPPPPENGFQFFKAFNIEAHKQVAEEPPPIFPKSEWVVRFGGIFVNALTQFLAGAQTAVKEYQKLIEPPKPK